MAGASSRPRPAPASNCPASNAGSCLAPASAVSLAPNAALANLGNKILNPLIYRLSIFAALSTPRIIPSIPVIPDIPRRSEATPDTGT